MRPQRDQLSIPPNVNSVATRGNLSAYRRGLLQKRMRAEAATSEMIEALRTDAVATACAYRSLAQRAHDPAIGAIVAVLVRDAEQNGALLHRMSTHGCEALNGGLGPGVRAHEAIDAVDQLAHQARLRAQHCRDVACAERGLEHHLCGALLDAIAADCDKHARLLSELGRGVRRSCGGTPS